MRVAYAVNRFPNQPPAVLNQITGLIDRGLSVHIFALGEDRTGIRHGLYDRYDLAALATCFATPHRSWSRRALNLVRAMPGCFITEPRASLHAWQVSQAWPGQRGVILHYLQQIRASGPASYDLLHCQWGDIGNVFVPAKYLWKSKLIVSFRGRDFHGLPKSHGRGIYVKLFDVADAVTVVSEQGRQVLLELGCPPDKLITHFSGTQVQRVPFSERRLDDGRPVRLLSVGRLLELKGFQVAIGALRGLSSASRPIEYHIVGDGPMREPLQTLAAEAGVADIVHFHGRKTWEEVVRLMLDSHICVVPSLSEGLPGVLLEAEASGLPIVASNAGGIAEGMVDGATGYLVRPGDVDGLTEGLLNLIERPDMWPAMGAAGRRHVERYFDVEVLNDRLVRLYEHVATGRPAGAFAAPSAVRT